MPNEYILRDPTAEDVYLATVLHSVKRLKSEKLPLKHLFPKQRALVADPARFKAALCTRRAGKSVGIGTALLQAAMKNPGELALYIALTLKSAKNIIWREIPIIAERMGIKVKPKEFENAFVLPEYKDSRIMLMGADQTNWKERLRGVKLARAVIDEAGAFRSDLQPLVDDVITPTLMDLDGDLIMVGTPGPIPNGYFYEVTELGKYGYSTHRWSVLDNPFLPKAREFIEETKQRNGWSDDNPTYRREWCGEWVQDSDALVYKFKRERNIYYELPREREWIRVMGVDFGFHDATAFVVLAYSPYDNRVFVEHASEESGLIPSEIAYRIISISHKFNPTRVVCDTGGLGKSITEELRVRHGIPTEAAEKTDKLAWIALMNGAFHESQIMIHDSLKSMADQYERLTKKEDGSGLENPEMPNHLADAALYAWRYCYPYHPKQRPEVKAEGDKVWDEIEENLMREREDNGIY